MLKLAVGVLFALAAGVWVAIARRRAPLPVTVLSVIAAEVLLIPNLISWIRFDLQPFTNSMWERQVSLLFVIPFGAAELIRWRWKRRVAGAEG